MPRFIECDKCKARGPEIPMGCGIGVQLVKSGDNVEGWSHVAIQTARPTVHPGLGTYYVQVTTDLDLCPACSTEVFDASGCSIARNLPEPESRCGTAPGCDGKGGCGKDCK